MSFAVESHPLSAAYLMLFSTALCLKLISFHHVMHDNRKKLRQLIKEGNTDPDINLSGLPDDTYKEVLKYPNTLIFSNFCVYLISPTCCYQLVYPRTSHIRTSFLIKRLLEIMICNFLIV